MAADMDKLTAALADLSDDDKTKALKALGVEEVETKAVPSPVDVRAEFDKLMAEKAEADRKAAEAAEQKAIAEDQAEVAKRDKFAQYAVEGTPGVPVPRPGMDAPGPGEEPQSQTKDYVSFYRAVMRDRRLQLRSPQDLVTVQLDEVPAHSRSAVQALQEWNDDLLLRTRITRKGGMPVAAHTLRGYDVLLRNRNWVSDIEKAAMYSTGSGVGDEWVPTVFSPQWMERVGEASSLMPLFRRVDMPSQPTTYPVFSNRSATAYLQAEPTIDDAAKYQATTITTAQVSLTAATIALRLVYTDTMVEDAVAGTMEYIRQDLAQSAAYWVEVALLNGDTSSTHMDTGGSYLSNSVYKAFDGLRHYATQTDTTANVSAAGITWTCANKLIDPLSTMGRYAGPNPVGICSPALARKLSLLENRGGYLVNNVGPQPEAAAQGPMGPLRLFGLRLSPTDAMSNDLNASGLYDNSTTTFTSLLWVNPEAFYIGTRRDWTLETDKDITTGQFNLVMTLRIGFGCSYATGEVTGLVYAIADSW